jgi:predicted dehydrogenase
VRIPRFAVIGAGGWATSMHLPAMQRLRSAGLAEYVGVCDLDGARAATYAAALETQAYTDVERLLAERRPDALVLLVAPPAMPGLIARAAAARIPFMAEKPPATDAATHRRLIDATGELPHMIAFNRRHAPYMTRAAEWMAGETPQLVTATFSRYRRCEPDFSTTAVHPLDAALFLAGGGLAEAHIEIARHGEVRNYFITGWTRRGVRVEVAVTPDTSTREEHYVVRGRNRSARVAFPYWNMLDYPGYVELHETTRLVARQSAGDLGIDPAAQFILAGVLAEHERFLKLLDGSAKPVSTLTTALETQLLREQLQTPGDRVTLDWKADGLA